MRGSAIYCNNFKTAIRLVESGKVNLKPLITHLLPLEDVKKGFEMLIRKTEPAFKVLLKPSPL